MMNTCIKILKLAGIVITAACVIGLWTLPPGSVLPRAVIVLVIATMPVVLAWGHI